MSTNAVISIMINAIINALVEICGDSCVSQEEIARLKFKALEEIERVEREYGENKAGLDGFTLSGNNEFE